MERCHLTIFGFRCGLQTLVRAICEGDGGNEDVLPFVEISNANHCDRNKLEIIQMENDVPFTVQLIPKRRFW